MIGDSNERYYGIAEEQRPEPPIPTESRPRRRYQRRGSVNESVLAQLAKQNGGVLVVDTLQGSPYIPNSEPIPTAVCDEKYENKVEVSDVPSSNKAVACVPNSDFFKASSASLSESNSVLKIQTINPAHTAETHKLTNSSRREPRDETYNIDSTKSQPLHEAEPPEDELIVGFCTERRERQRCQSISECDAHADSTQEHPDHDHANSMIMKTDKTGVAGVQGDRIKVFSDKRAVRPKRQMESPPTRQERGRGFTLQSFLFKAFGSNNRLKNHSSQKK